MADEHDEERPWTEEQWEEFMRHADLRAARYGELMETLIDDPDRDNIIDHEMGWDRKRERVDEEWMKELEQAAAEAEEELKDLDEDDDDSADTTPRAGRADLDDFRDRELEAIPAYAICEQASEAIDAVLVPLMRGEGEDEGDEDVAQAFIQIKIASAKIANGHGMGYEDEVLGGNVVNCKRSLAAVDECEVALRAVARRKLIPAETVPPLLEHVAKAHKAICDRIAELRARMWWQ